MKLAIMQPYFFPYIGYFQLINAVDKFVFYDDVNFIKGGWINRNRILVNGEIKFFTVPITGVSSFKKTKETRIKRDQFFQWKKKMFKTLKQNYGKKKFYLEVIPLIESVLEEDVENIGELAKQSIVEVLKYLEIETNLVWTSEVYNNSDLRREERILDICTKENVRYYYNLIGGISIYDKLEFKRKGVQLNFLQSRVKPYKQANENFVPSLSIIDVLMNNSKDDVKEMLSHYVII